MSWKVRQLADAHVLLLPPFEGEALEMVCQQPTLAESLVVRNSKQQHEHTNGDTAILHQPATRGLVAETTNTNMNTNRDSNSSPACYKGPDGRNNKQTTERTKLHQLAATAWCQKQYKPT